MSTQSTDAFTILRELGFNPTAQGLDRAVAGLAKRLSNYERALAETREMLAEAEKVGAVKALRALATQSDKIASTWPPGDEVAIREAGAASSARSFANCIERGEVTL